LEKFGIGGLFLKLEWILNVWIKAFFNCIYRSELIFLNNKFIKMVKLLTKETFKEKIFDYEKNKEWKFEGELPCMIDFYADWCQPCKIVEPILEELAEEYEGKIDIFRINTEEEQELSAIFGIRSIPSLLFVPKDAQPQMAVGALPKDTFEKAIKDVLKVNKK
jgi:thioredoxin 1